MEYNRLSLKGNRLQRDFIKTGTHREYKNGFRYRGGKEKMYRKAQGWEKHVDFIILDMICLQIAYVMAYALAGYGGNLYSVQIYRNIAIFLELADLVTIFMFDTLKNVLKRGAYQNMKITVQHSGIVGALTILYLFLLQQGEKFSRFTLVMTFILYIILTYLVRELWKRLLRKQMETGTAGSLLIATTNDIAEEVIQNMKDHNYGRHRIAGAVILDQDRTGEIIAEIPVVASEETAPEYVCQEWINEVLIVASKSVPYPAEMIDRLSETGVIVHMNLTQVSNKTGKRQFVERVGNYTVLTTSINYATDRQLVMKRMMDIAGGLVGCLLTGIIFLFIAPVIYISSPGPIFFSQERVGKNGRRFKMYKFRSMYMDAEKRKAELMKENKMGDGKMFKLDFDPRVIGNKILPDGTKKTGVGDFIRKTSLDEFPQFFNVLKGDMSIVGTRPPLIGEVSLYELHHRARLAIKPGITGMWQVSGRSDITDFEEVVRLDREYIENWSFGLDVKILVKTVLAVFMRDGAA